VARDQDWSCKSGDGAHDINWRARKLVSIPVEVSGGGPCDVAPNQQSSLRANGARIRATRWLAMTARHDDGQTWLRDLAEWFFREMFTYSRPLRIEGAGNAGRPMRPRSRVQW